jgi:3-oxoacyl-[acyl-carrier protein] reductase
MLGPQGIRVNAVAPGVVDADMSNFTKTESGREATLGMQALKRIGKPEDLADVVAFLASDGARWITALVSPSTEGRSFKAGAWLVEVSEFFILERRLCQR